MSYPRHQWVDNRGAQTIGDKMSDTDYRRCRACGVTQTRDPEFLWMRKTGRGTWEPRVSPRCEGAR